MSFQDLEPGHHFNSHGERTLQNQQQFDPSRAVAAGVFQINTAVASYQRLVNSIGTPKDSIELRQNLQKTKQHIGQLVKETSSKLKQVSETDHYAEISPGKKIADAKLARDFQSVLREFQKAQRLAIEKEITYAPPVPKEKSFSRKVEISSSKRPEQYSLHVESMRQEMSLENHTVFNEAVIEERDKGIKEIQRELCEVNEIFKDLAVMVQGQGSLIDDISSNVERSRVATTQANSNLAKASKMQRSSSSTQCLLLVIIGIIVLIVVTIVVS